MNPKANFYQLDIRHAILRKVFEEEHPEVICHLAAQHSIKISTDDPVQDASVNILGLINLLQDATRFGVRKIVIFSSRATNGAVKKMPVDETITQNLESPYGTTKWRVNMISGSGRICTVWNSQFFGTAMSTDRDRILLEGRWHRLFCSPNPAHRTRSD